MAAILDFYLSSHVPERYLNKNRHIREKEEDGTSDLRPGSPINTILGARPSEQIFQKLYNSIVSLADLLLHIYVLSPIEATWLRSERGNRGHRFGRGPKMA